jgi:hypothetical protein
MKATQTKQPSDQPSEDDVLRRMLATPPKQHDAKPAPTAKVATKKKSSK